MNATPLLDHGNSSFSKLLLSREVADIIKQVVRESNQAIHPKCDDKENPKENYDV